MNSRSALATFATLILAAELVMPGGVRAALPDGATAVPSAEGATASPLPGAHSTLVRDGLTYAHRAVETGDPEAQFDFDRGLTLLYAFDPAEARAAFGAAAARDPKLAMAQWGIALSHQPNINTDFDSADQRAGRDAIGKARALETTASPADRALIEAAIKRFASDRSRDTDAIAQAYRDAMETVANAFPDDDDVQVLAAESALDVHPWEYFNDDGKAKPWTPAIIARLETVLARDPDHIGANHYLIHAEEESGKFESAEPAARRLFAMRFEPAAEHLEHMPAHIFMQTGAYHDAGVANERAVDEFIAYRSNDDGTEKDHEGYFGHDCEFGVQAFTMAGEEQRAMKLARSCNRPRYAMEVDLRFGRYADAHMASPHSDFAAAYAAIAGGDEDAAQKSIAQLKGDATTTTPLMHDLLAARLAQARGDASEALRLLSSAVHDEDVLGYSEPPRFYYPVRESLGAAYLRAGDFAKAEKTFEDDLAHNRDNPRSLFGLAAALDKAGKTAEAAQARERFTAAWKYADAPPDLETM